MSNSIQRDVSIDKFHLDEEARLLPSLMGKYHERIYERTQELNRLEFDLEKEEASARKHVREMFTAEGRKYTVDMVNDEVSSLEAIRQLRRDLSDARAEVNYLKGVLASLEAKRSSLNNLVSLYCKAYFDEEKQRSGEYREADVKHSLSREYEHMADEQTSNLRNAKDRR